MALSKLLWQKGFSLSSLNPYSQLQLPRFMTHSTLTIPGILLKMSQHKFLTQAVLSLMSGSVPVLALYFVQNRDANKLQTRFDAIDTRLNAMNTSLCRLDQNVKNFSAQTTNCTAECAAAKRALLGYGLFPRS